MTTRTIDRLCVRCWTAFRVPGQELCQSCIRSLRLVAVTDRAWARELDVRRQAFDWGADASYG